jgi:glutaminase
LELKVKRDNLKSKSLTPLLYSKIKLKNFNLVNLELEENASVNPDTNNGAYIIAEKQRENEKITRLEILPTSFVKVYDATKRSSRLLNMTFSKEALNMDKKYILKNEVNKNKNEV